MQRSPQSHKGQNGKVAVVGGSRAMHGAPVFSALSAEASGVDLIYLSLPSHHAEAAKNASLNFQVHPFGGADITAKDVDAILELLATVDSAVLGPGLARDAKAQDVMQQIIGAASCPLVLDASALQEWTLKTVQGKVAVLTPHLGELERLGVEPQQLGHAARQYGVVIHQKGPADRIAAADGTVRTVEGGNAGLTVGGTGDALSGLIAGLIAQGTQPAEACVMASTVIKRAGTMLYETQGFAYSTRKVIGLIPQLLHMLE